MSLARRRLPGPRRYRAASSRNSECGSALIKDLDFSRWFTDGAPGDLYLHVYKADPTGAGDTTIHRVYCRHSDSPRLELCAGTLYWLVDAARKKAATP